MCFIAVNCNQFAFSCNGDYTRFGCKLQEEFAKSLENRENGVIITIGDENEDVDMKECSLITATYHVEGKLVGKLGVIGPTRMKYGEVTSVIEFMTQNLESTFKLIGGFEDDS